MGNHLSDILAIWEPQKDLMGWVLATIVETEGSSYRKPGAMMLINDLGQYYGLLSGGCLESDIMRHARECMEKSDSKTIEYDMREETDIAWQLGLGCGGRVRILLQPINLEHDYLQLDKLQYLLMSGKRAFYLQCLQVQSDNKHNQASNDNISHNLLNESPFSAQQLEKLPDHFISEHSPQIAVAIFGGGVDARPIVAMAVNMGWQVYLIDHRTGYARDKYFSGCKQIIRQSAGELAEQAFLQRIDAAIVMTHNIELDAAALVLLENSAVQYIGLLGPTHRTERVFEAVDLNLSNYNKPLWNPMGLSIGGELPESIALSVLSEIHAVLYQRNGGSIGSPKNQTMNACH